MATVTLEDLWLHDDSDHTSYVQLPASELVEDSSVPVQVGRYAAGTLRAVVGSGQARKMDVTVGLVSRTDVDTVRGWAGQKLMVRDPLGRVWWAVHDGVKVTERPLPSVGTVFELSFTLREVTGSVAV